jgi:hypothetical protein
MKRLTIIAMLIALGFVGNAFAAAPYNDLAMHWAPRVYEGICSIYDTRADFITNFDYDGDWVGNNNWDHTDNCPEYGYAYYKVQETNTHYFIEYDFYHSRDAGPTPLDCHENDLEGIIVCIRKDGSQYGSFHLMETFAHNQWYQYTNDTNITSGSDGVDGPVLFNGTHPEIYIQPNNESPWGGHGIQAYDGSGLNIWETSGIVYNCTGTAEYPTNVDGSYVYSYGYALRSIDELWSRRYDTGGAGHTFDTYGNFDGNNYMNDGAKGPWLWDDADDGPAFAGMNFSDPAHMIDTHLNGLGTFSHNYIYNPYYIFKVTISTITSEANRDPFGGKSDIYPKFWFNGNYLDQMDRLWKYNDSAIGVQRQVFWGYNNATFNGQYSEAYNTLYVCHIPSRTQVRINIMDSDGSSGDDDMGSVYATPLPGQTATWTNASTDSGQALLSASVTANTE